MPNPTESVPTDQSLVRIRPRDDGNYEYGEPISSSAIVAKGWPALVGKFLQPDTTDERNADIRACVTSITTLVDFLHTFNPTVTVRELESAGVLPSRSTYLHTLITNGLVKNERGSA